MERKLNFELVPDSCWYSNLRSLLTKEQWDYIKLKSKKKANGKCSICGESCQKLETHERWEYDEKASTQRLKEIISVCPKCHKTIHIGLSQLKGWGEMAENHYMKVNGVSYSQMREDLGIANQNHQRLNRVSDWKLDLTYLKEFIENE